MIHNAGDSVNTSLPLLERVPPERVYFRTAPCFETAALAHAWLHRMLFVGFGQRLPDSVHIRISAV